MNILIPCIREIDELEKCEIIPINHKLWGTDYPVKAFGRMAIIPDKEWVVSMTAEETNPLRRYDKDNDPVYRDSALEVFLNFQPEDEKKRYMNFEMNANGAMLSEFGEKGDRKYISDIYQEYSASCKAKIEENSWSVQLRIPLKLIRELYSSDIMKKGGRFTFNLYKLSEDPEQEHYLSYSDLPVSRPDFHLPQYFASGWFR
jgi:hypothetical protein